MSDSNIEKLYNILDALEKAGKDKEEIKAIRKLIENGNLSDSLERIRKLNNTESTKEVKKKTKRVIKKKESKQEDNEDEQEEEIKEINEEDNEADDYDIQMYDTEDGDETEDMFKDEATESYDDEDDEIEEQQENEDDEEYDKDEYEDDNLDEDNEEESEDDDFNFGEEKVKPKYKEEVKKVESAYPEKLRNEELEKTYVGLLLNNPKLIVKYYIIFDECYFDDQSLLNIYKSILFTEGGNYTPEIAKKGFNFSVDNNETYKQKQLIKNEIAMKNFNPEKVYNELRKLCILRKDFLEEPRKEIQEQIVGIKDYELYDQMSADEVKAAIVQVSVTQKFKQSVLSEDLTTFLEKGENNLTNGLELPFPILSSVFKGIRKGETMAFAMPSNSGKSRFTINIAAYTAFIHKKKVLIISNEMSEEKMKLCLITTVINNPEIQKLHGQEISKTEGELLEFKFRPDKDAKVNVDEEGFILQEEKETRKEFVERLKNVSSEFNKTIAVTDWVNNQINNSIYFINITDHTNDELKKVIMNYYYKEKIEYVKWRRNKKNCNNTFKLSTKL